MRRLFFNFAAAASLLVCVAAIALWVRGAVGDPIRYQLHVWDESGLTDRSISLYGGVVRLALLRQRTNTRLSADELVQIKNRESRLAAIAPPPSPATASAVNNDFVLYAYSSTVTRLRSSQLSQWALWFRLWPVALLAAVMPGVWLGRKLRAARRRRSGRCLACGYDLRATPDRCPECGAEAAT